MACCGKNSVGSVYQANRSQTAIAPKTVTIPAKYKWQWKGLSPADDLELSSDLLEDATDVSPTLITFNTEGQARKWIENGHPGTLTVISA